MNCSRCGGALSGKSDICPYCGVRNDLNLYGVHHEAVQVNKDRDWICPRCDVKLKKYKVEILDQFYIERCPECFGIFLTSEDLAEVLEDVVNTLQEIEYKKLTNLIEEGLVDRWPTKYIKCPVCREFMNRKNYGANSGVVTDTCKNHGVWLDGGEFNKLLRWAHSGGVKYDKRRKKDEERMRNRKFGLHKNTGINWDDPDFGMF